MFYTVSKLFWTFADPSRAIGLVIILAGLLLVTPFKRTARFLLAFGCLAYLALAFLPVGNWILRPLEDRFHRPTGEIAAPDGILILGGTIDEALSNGRGVVTFSPHAARMTEAVILARRFPNARMVFSSGSKPHGSEWKGEAELALQFLTESGVDPKRITLETDSRNTWENAVYSKKLLAPKPGERWLMITSAFHMPRAMGIFRRVGFDVIPWPVDYKTEGTEGELTSPHMAGSEALGIFDLAASEWIGLLAYRLADKSAELFPAEKR